MVLRSYRLTLYREGAGQIHMGRRSEGRVEQPYCTLGGRITYPNSQKVQLSHPPGGEYPRLSCSNYQNPQQPRRTILDAMRRTPSDLHPLMHSTNRHLPHLSCFYLLRPFPISSSVWQPLMHRLQHELRRNLSRQLRFGWRGEEVFRDGRLFVRTV